MRVELAINGVLAALPGSKLTAEYQYSYDDVREDRHEIGARLRLPFGGTNRSAALRRLTGVQRRMHARVERNTGIVTAKSDREAVEDALTGTDFDRVAILAAGSDISALSAASGDNSLLIVNGTVNSGTQTVAANQTVQSGGSTIQIRGRRTGVVHDFTAPGAAATVRNGAGPVIALQGNNTHIAGLTIDGLGTSTFGVSGGASKTNIAITQNRIQNAGTDGINFTDNNQEILISDTSIANSGSEAIAFNNDNSGIRIAQVDIAGTGAEGIEFEQRNSDVSITGGSITNAGTDAIGF